MHCRQMHHQITLHAKILPASGQRTRQAPRIPSGRVSLAHVVRHIGGEPFGPAGEDFEAGGAGEEATAGLEQGMGEGPGICR